MLVSYPALFYYVPTEKVPFFISFPDFRNGNTQGQNISDAMLMASDWLGINVADNLENDRILPKPSKISTLSLDKNNPFPKDLQFDSSQSFISMVLVDLNDYLDDQKIIKKTLSIPKWADKAGKELKLNFSQTLTEAIAEKKLQQGNI